MDNMVGDNVPSQKKLDAILELFLKLVGELQHFCITLDAEARAGTVKPPRGNEEWVARVADLSTRYGVAAKSAPIAGMLNDARLAQALGPYQPHATLLAQLMADTLLQARSEYWSAFLQNYGALAREAEHDPALAAELKPVQEFMRTVHASKPVRPAPGPTPAAAPPAPAPQQAPAIGATPPGSPTGATG
jgi:hypothetical protein